MMKTLLPLAAALMTAASTAPRKPHAKPNHPITPRGVTSRKASPSLRHRSQDQAAAQIRAVLRRARGEGRSLMFPPPDIWLSSYHQR